MKYVKIIMKIILLISFIVYIAAQTTPPISITSPLTGTIYTSGISTSITWINPTVSTLSEIQLVQGPADALQEVMLVASNISTSSGSYTWIIPKNIAPGTNYALSLGSSPNIAYSGFFTIKGDSPVTSSLNSASSSISSMTSSTFFPTQTSISQSTPNSPSLGIGAIVGIAIGGLIVGIIIGLFIFYFNRHKQPAVMEETLPSYDQQKPDAYITNNSKPDDTYTNKPDNID
jgi:hypothetical protein